MIKYFSILLLGLIFFTGCGLTSESNKAPLAIKSAQDGKFILSRVVIPDKPAFVVLYADNSGGQPGRTVAQSGLLAPGEHKDVLIGSSNIQSGITYHALIHTDNGDKVFRIKEDPVLYGDDGKMITATIIAK